MRTRTRVYIHILVMLYVIRFYNYNDTRHKFKPLALDIWQHSAWVYVNFWHVNGISGVSPYAVETWVQ